MKYFGFLCCLILIFSCAEHVQKQSNAVKESASADTTAIPVQRFDTVSVIDTVQIDNLIIDLSFLSKEQETLLETEVKEFVTTEEYQDILVAINLRKSITTAEDLYKYYTDILPKAKWALTEGMTKSHPAVMYSGDSEPADDWQFITKLIPDLVAKCLCGECMSEAHILTNKMYELALKTPEKEDEQYFAYAMEVFYYGWEDREKTGSGEGDKIFDGSNDGFSIHDHCSVCYYNSLGDFFHFNALEYAFSKEWDLYQAKVDDIIDYARFGDYAYNFYYNKPEVMGEIKALEGLALNQEFKDGLIKLKERIEVGTDIFYGCQTGECPTP
jgi:hypothetical protein